MSHIDEIQKVEVRWFRWLIRRDMPDVLNMECQTERPWTDDEWLDVLRNRNAIGMVAEDPLGRIVGAILYELNKGHLSILRLLVDESCRRQGIASYMIFRLKDKLSQQRRNELVCCVPERRMDVLHLLQATGFEVHAYERTDLGPFSDDLMIEMRYVLDRDFDEDDLCDGSH